MGCSLPSSSVHGILQARILEWVAIPFFRGSSLARDWTLVSCIAGRFFTIWSTWEPLELQGSTNMQVFFPLINAMILYNDQLNLKMKNHSPEWRTDCKVIHGFSTMRRGSVPLILTLFKSQLYFQRKKNIANNITCWYVNRYNFATFPTLPPLKNMALLGFFCLPLLQTATWI